MVEAPMNSFVEIGEHRIYSRHWAGTRPTTFVFIHGLIVSGRYFLPLASYLASLGFSVYLPDLPGAGKSSSVGAMSREERAELVDAYIKQLGGPVVLVANSYGTQVATELAISSKDDVEAVVLIGPTCDPCNDYALHKYFFRWLGCMPFLPLWNVLVKLLDAKDVSVKQAQTELASLTTYDLEEKIVKVRQPLFLIRGRFDFISRKEWLVKLANLAPRGKQVQISRAAHEPHASYFEKVGDSIEEFVREN